MFEREGLFHAFDRTTYLDVIPQHMHELLCLPDPLQLHLNVHYGYKMLSPAHWSVCPPTLRWMGSGRRNRRKPQQIGLCVRRQANAHIDEHLWHYVVVRKGEGPFIRICGSGYEIRLLLVVYRLGGV